MSESRLKLNEVFFSIQGESTLSGLPTLFVRFHGCNLDCRFCDTPGARRGGAFRWWEPDELLRWISAWDCRRVCLTGGEPLLQREGLVALSRRLLDGGFEISLETNGSLDVGGLPPGLRRVMDVKSPGSGMADRMRHENLEKLGEGDEVKFVLCDQADFKWAAEMVRRRSLADRLPVLFSPAQGRLSPATLAGWILQEALPVRLQLQLHRIIWPGGREGLREPRPGGVDPITPDSGRPSGSGGKDR